METKAGGAEPTYMLVISLIGLMGIVVVRPIFALRGFANKCGAALTSGILMFTLSLTGYEANAPVQTDLALFGIVSSGFWCR